MKIHRLLLFVVALLFISMALRAAQAPKLETLLAEYKKARADVIGKLNEAYASKADTLAAQYQAIPNLDGADRARRFAERLRDPDQNNDFPDIGGSCAADDPLATLQSNYASARADNLNNVYTFYSTTAENLRRQLIQEKDQAGASVLATFLQKIKPPRVTPSVSANPAKKGKAPAK